MLIYKVENHDAEIVKVSNRSYTIAMPLSFTHFTISIPFYNKLN
jgi:hypothetical protein